MVLNNASKFLITAIGLLVGFFSSVIGRVLGFEEPLESLMFLIWVCAVLITLAFMIYELKPKDDFD